jgi:hypothetical protein
MLLYAGAMDDPRVTRLDDAAAMFWVALIGACSARGRDTLGVDEVEAANDARKKGGDVSALLDELEQSDLVARLPHGHVRLLARLDLWAFEDEADPAASVG